MRRLDKGEVRKFQKKVWSYYMRHGRHTLPWRKTHDPYHILVSEIMLQQTQVERVIPKYAVFLEKFKNIKMLARAPLGDVLRIWSGLGYNRRARMLHEAAQCVVHTHKGVFPKTQHELMNLPGLGHYTAGAIVAFAYNTPVSFIETNIRSVYIHHFFTRAQSISDRAILMRVNETLPTTRIREWYYALMDYGVYLKRQYKNPGRKSAHHTTQTRFIGSDRQIRGAILRLLTKQSVTTKTLTEHLSQFEKERVEKQCLALLKEGMVVRKKNVWSLP